MIDKMTGALGLKSPLDRESLTSVNIVLKATEDCSSGKYDNLGPHFITWNASDPSLLLVKVLISDINDNGPRFTRKWFTAGVTRDTQPGEEPVINLRVISHVWYKRASDLWPNIISFTYHIVVYVVYVRQVITW